MDTIIRRKAQLSVAAVAALAIFALAAVMLLAGGFTTGTAQADDRGGGTGGDTPTSPQPCGPGLPDANFPDPPAEMVPSGHYALFDAYWLPDPGLADDTKTGTLNTNLCPPAATHKEVGTEEVTTLSASNIDLRTTIIHVGDQYEADVVATDAEAGTTKLSLEKYTEVRKGLGLLGPKNEKLPLPANTKVHWLRLEDGDLPPSDLVLGFSTGKLDGDYWHNHDGGPTFQYEMESVRVLGANPADLPHVLTYWEPEIRTDVGTAKIVWDSSDVDTNAMPQGAGEYEHLEWVFTKPGTYVLSVHLKGHVRQSKPANFVGSWEKRTPEKTVTSVPHRYVFQVGDLHINDQPHFGAVRSVTAGTPAGRPVGDVIALYGRDADTLELDLDGVGSEDFDVAERSTPWSGGALLFVAEDAELRYPYPGAGSEDPDEAYYDLHLKVSDKHAYENYVDNKIDDIIPLRIHVQPQSGPWVSLRMSDEHPRAREPGKGGEILITAKVHGLESGWSTSDVTLFEGVGDQKRELEPAQQTHALNEVTFRVERAEAGTQRYWAVFSLGNQDSNIQSKKIGSGWYPVVWRK